MCVLMNKGNSCVGYGPKRERVGVWRGGGGDTEIIIALALQA